MVGLPLSDVGCSVLDSPHRIWKRSPPEGQAGEGQFFVAVASPEQPAPRSLNPTANPSATPMAVPSATPSATTSLNSTAHPSTNPTAMPSAKPMVFSVDAATTLIRWGFTCDSNVAGCCSDPGYCDIASKTVTVGDTVEWTAVGGHNIVSGANRAADSKFSSPWLTSGTSFNHTFEEAGEYPYYCSPHGGMNAKITVLAAVAENTPNPTKQPTRSPTSQTTQPSQTLTAAKYTVVGAGPGGVLAAHILSQADPDSTLRLLERGGLPVAETYTTMFASSYNRQPSFPAATYNGNVVRALQYSNCLCTYFHS